jgi:hypothetical protein
MTANEISPEIPVEMAPEQDPEELRQENFDI